MIEGDMLFTDALKRYDVDTPFGHLYNRIFAERRLIRSILVIGCGNDARSIGFCNALTDFFTTAHVVAIDVLPVSQAGTRPNPRVSYICMDAELHGFWRMLPTKSFDLIIDDVRSADVAIFSNVMEIVKPDTMYIIEYVDAKSQIYDVHRVAEKRMMGVQVYDYYPSHPHMVAIVNNLRDV